MVCLVFHVLGKELALLRLLSWRENAFTVLTKALKGLWTCDLGLTKKLCRFHRHMGDESWGQLLWTFLAIWEGMATALWLSTV